MGLAVASSPFHLSLCFLVLLCLCSGYPHTAGAMLGGNETDRSALLAFKAEITGDPFGALTSWNESSHFCQWSGVTCGRRHRRVTVLDLGDQQLSGSITPHIGNLSFLRKIWLPNNIFSQQIPPELGRLRRLQILHLGNNSFSGRIPANISAASRLTKVVLRLNRLEGQIPKELGSLSKLKLLRVGKNSLTGVVPSTLGNLSSLETFHAPQNSIGGNLPDELGRLTSLRSFGMAMNRLVGTIPSSIFNLSFIQVIDVGVNEIQGSLPSELGLILPDLKFLSVFLNLFTGSVPFSLSNASKLEVISMAGNSFTGNVPPLGRLHNLRFFSLSYNNLGTGEAKDLNFLPSLTNATYLSDFLINTNNFGGVLPDAICNFSTNLGLIALDNNKITGNIPNGIENLVNLGAISLWNNKFTGEIPSGIGKLRQLQTLSLSTNNFSGNIPMFLGNLSLLLEFYADKNDFDGNIPSNLGNCKQLQILSLDCNNLNGTIPREVVVLPSMLNLTVSENHLTGSLPIEVGSMTNLEVLDVSKNILSGEISSTIGGCVKLRLLYVVANNFQGTIPSSFSNLRGLEELDLSSNNFSGKLPDFFGDFIFLQKLNLSLNDFEGMVPERGIFKNATTSFVQGNKRLCGGIPELHLQSCNSKGSRRKISSLILKLVIPTTVCLVGVLLVIYFLYCSRFRRRTRVPFFGITSPTFQNVSYRSLRQATGGFSEANLIGVGGFGSVYKGVLDQGGQVVAVKVLNLQFRGASKSFLAECKALKNMKHRNLVKVLTVCSSIDYRGNDFKALVYEFMVNGSLDEWLHPKENEYAANEDSRHLNLLQRLDIAIDVASALDYIHNHCPEPIVHCDLKPRNVLLDEEMTGHVGDFGLAKFFPKAILNSSQPHDLSSSIGVRGSVGYVAPEYGMGNEMSTSGDVFSYGILLLELFTGKRPTDDMFSDELSLHNFVKINLPEKIEGIADPRLFKQREEVEASSSDPAIQFHSFSSGQRNLECLISLLKIGIACSEELPRDRMAISDVVAQLHAIKNIHFKAGRRHGGRRDGRQLGHE